MNQMLSIVVPTRNEAANVSTLVQRVSEALGSSEWELIFVDDSDDGTPDAVAALAHPRVRLRHRPVPDRRGGLAGAVCDGFAAARGELLVVMDGDLQHDPAMLPALRGSLDEVDIAIASRYAAGECAAGLDGLHRVLVSRASRAVARALFPRVRRVRDPLAGFFAFRRILLDGARLQPVGFKILLELLVRGSWRSVRELPYRMAERQAGSSNASLREGLRFGTHLLRLRFTT